MIKNKIEKVVEELKDDSIIHPKEDHKNKIPTLKIGVYREISPMLLERFNFLGAWEDSTHGDWLSISEMEVLWLDDDKILNERIKEIKNNLLSISNNWENDATAIFKNSRLSVFAASAYTNERIYLIWLDEIIEPEIWVYDTNGFSRFRDLELYLDSYINDDVENNHEWILAYINN